MEPIDCKETPYCYECNYRYQTYQNAFNDPDLSLSAKLLWALISERKEGFDSEEYLDNLCEEDLMYGPLMELVNKGYFSQSYLEHEMKILFESMEYAQKILEQIPFRTFSIKITEE
jgi:hypothetical protein